MIAHIRDDGLPQFSRRWIVGLAAVAWVSTAGGVVPAAQAQEVLQASVRPIEADRDWIRIPSGKSVIIETNVPISHVQTPSPEIAHVQSISPTQIIVTGRSFGRTQVIIGTPDGQQQSFNVSVELELDLLKQAIGRIDPLAKVDIFPIMETIVLGGTVSDADAADRIFQIASIFSTNVQNHLRVAGQQQVMVRCTVAEISRSAMRQLGVNGFLWGNDFRDFPVVSNIGGINPVSFGRPGGPTSLDIPFASAATGVGGNATFSFGLPRVQTQIFLQALRENGLLKILAEPNLVTISGHTASFLAGGEFPVPVPQQGSGGGGTTITIEYREFGIRLAFTPVVLANQMIRLSIAPEVSELDFASGVQIAGFQIPALSSRRAETTVELGSGQTLAIAGLLSENIRAASAQLPGLGDIPILGALFRSVEYQKDITELVILATPEIVGPLNPGELPDLPGDSHLDPDDWELFALGMMEGKPAVSKGELQWVEDQPLDASTSASDLPADLAAQAAFMGPWGLADYEEGEEE